MEETLSHGISPLVWQVDEVLDNPSIAGIAKLLSSGQRESTLGSTRDELVCGYVASPEPASPAHKSHPVPEDIHAERLVREAAKNLGADEAMEADAASSVLYLGLDSLAMAELAARLELAVRQ